MTQLVTPKLALHWETRVTGTQAVGGAEASLWLEPFNVCLGTMTLSRIRDDAPAKTRPVAGLWEPAADGSQYGGAAMKQAVIDASGHWLGHLDELPTGADPVEWLRRAGLAKATASIEIRDSEEVAVDTLTDDGLRLVRSAQRSLFSADVRTEDLVDVENCVVHASDDDDRVIVKCDAPIVCASGGVHSGVERWMLTTVHAASSD